MKRKEPSVKELQQRIRWLKRDVDQLSDTLSRAKNRNLMYRGFIESQFNWFIELLAKGQRPDMQWLIREYKNQLVRTKGDD